MRFGINSIVFLVIILITAVAWIVFEYYHQSNNIEVPPELLEHESKPLPSSYDAATLQELYQSKDKFYESESSSQEE